jgi:hypothetical protein
MQLKKRVALKPPHKLATRHVEESAGHLAESRGLNAAVRFFVDHIIGVAVSSVARKQTQTARLAVTGSSGSVFQVLISAMRDEGFVAYSNDMGLLLGASSGLYVVNNTPRELEHSIYLYMSERLAGEGSVRAQIFRESASVFELPVLEGSSNEGPRSLKPREGAAAG